MVNFFLSTGLAVTSIKMEIASAALRDGKLNSVRCLGELVNSVEFTTGTYISDQ